MSPRKLPVNVFADNPLRPTLSSVGQAAADDSPETPAVSFAGAETMKPAAPTTPPLMPAPASGPQLSAVTPGMPSPATAPLASTVRLGSPTAPVTVKHTVYLPVDAINAIDDEVYARKRSGQRGYSSAELFREIVQEWMARRTSQRRDVANG